MFSYKGGLGNQLYQLSFLNYLNKLRGNDKAVLFYLLKETGDSRDKTKRNTFTDILDYLGLKAYRVNEERYWDVERVARRLRRFIKPLICFHYEPFKQQAVFQPEPLFEGGCFKCNSLKNFYFGFFQSYQYLDVDFTRRIYDALRQVVNSYTTNTLLPHSRFIKPNPQDVAIHLRRGDFMKVQEIFRCFTSEHYLRGLSLLEQEEPIGKVYVFSDDFEAISGELAEISTKYEIVKVEGNSVAEDIVQMAAFRRFVLANSTFSWWAAFMAETREAVRVVVPEQPLHWHREDDSYFPAHWTKLKD